jgi:hypothetical protein
MKKQQYLILLGFIIIYLVYSNTKTRYSQKRDIIQINNIVKEDKEEEEESKEPRKYYDSRFYPRKRMAVNVPTRGEPPEYQQVGILTGESGEEDTIKPLFGRQTYRGSNQWNYFTSLDSHLSTKIPVYMNNQDCTDERGCNELHKGGSVSMGEGGATYNTSLYGNIAPRYIPYI